MNIVTSPVAAASPAACDPAPACFAAAEAILPLLESGIRVDAKALRMAMEAAGISPGDVVLEPSAGTGLLAAMARMLGGDLALNELSDLRAGLLERLFAEAAVTQFDAAHIHDHLASGVSPNVVLMNPPFSALANVKTRARDAALRHVASALARLAPGGRLVAITGAGFSPEVPAPGAMALRGCKRPHACPSRRASTVGSLPATAPASTPGFWSLIKSQRRIRRASWPPLAWPRMLPR